MDYFVEVYWGKKDLKEWQFEGLESTILRALNISTKHCLSRQIRAVYPGTRINIGTHQSPKMVRADSVLLPKVPDQSTRLKTVQKMATSKQVIYLVKHDIPNAVNMTFEEASDRIRQLLLR